MLHLFFTISFAAEIIVCCWIISKLKKLDSIIIEKKRVRGVAVLRIVSKFARQVREKLAQKGLSKQL